MYTDVLHGLLLYFLLGHCQFTARCSLVSARAQYCIIWK